MNHGDNNRDWPPIKRVGIVGWRGMVGSVLTHRMSEEGDWQRKLQYTLYSTSQAGRSSPIDHCHPTVRDAYNLTELSDMDCLLTCQGSTYTEQIHPQLRAAGWTGYWIDAASYLRTEPTSTLVLDPINRPLIIDRLRAGCRDFIGANCTVSLMMIAIARLLIEQRIEWINAVTYQSASGAGAGAMDELLRHSCLIGEHHRQSSDQPLLETVRQIDQKLLNDTQASSFPIPLCANLIPWIDRFMPDSGQSREEWKAAVECQAILGQQGRPVPIEGVCVRVPVMRCHSQSLLLCMKQPTSVAQASELLADNPWVDLIDNTPESTTDSLHPLAVSGSLRIKVGRLRQPQLSADSSRFLQMFTVGDQLLWGAAEPLRRMLDLLVGAD